MFLKTDPALAQHLAWHEQMKQLRANPVLDALAARWRREREQMLAAVALLKIEG